MGCRAGVLSRDCGPVQVLECLLMCRGDEVWNLPPSKRKRPRDVAAELGWTSVKVYSAATQLRNHGYIRRSRGHKPYFVTDYGIRAMKRYRIRWYGRPKQEPTADIDKTINPDTGESNEHP